MTVLELLIVVAIIGTLVAIAVPNLLEVLAGSKIKRAMADLRVLEIQIIEYEFNHGELPDSLGLLPRLGGMRDPWGNPYQYLKIRGADRPPRGQWRKDRFLVPINSDFDLYSMGPDGQSRPPLTARHSRDDIIRAANGAFVGVAEDY
jgi:general secretion pathway protein G